MTWQAEVLILPDTFEQRGTRKAAAGLVGQTASVDVAGKKCGTCRVLSARYEPGVGVHAWLEFGDDCTIGDAASMTRFFFPSIGQE